MKRLLVESVLVISLTGLAACATTRTTAPKAGEINLPSAYRFKTLQQQPVAITILDQRSDTKDSEALVSLTSNVLTKALQDAGVRVDGTAKDRIVEVRIVEYRADFEFAEWKGCTKLITVFNANGSDPKRIDSAKCVTMQNMWGYGSADEALHAAYKDSVAHLLAELDLLPSANGPREQSPQSETTSTPTKEEPPDSMESSKVQNVDAQGATGGECPKDQMELQGRLDDLKRKYYAKKIGNQQFHESKSRLENCPR